MPRITVIINNYNYGRFLKQSIESVLHQSYPAHEVILVDDGSTDESAEVALSFGDRIKFIPQKNSGQASTFNTGYYAATGDWIWFLDSDDMLAYDALEEVSKKTGNGVSKIHGKLIMTDIDGQPLGKMAPITPLSEGNVIRELEQNGFYSWPPTSGNVFPRHILEACMPVPEDKFRLCVDLYLCNNAAMKGDIVAVKKPVGYYRIHGSNNFSGYRLQGKVLKNQALNLIAAVDLLEQLFRDTKDYRFPYDRWNFEMLLLADRFSDFESPYSHQYLYENWLQTPQIAGQTSLRKLALVLHWYILKFMPKKVIEKINLNLGFTRSKSI
ncbi:MAG TPA: glycosyltransferase family 2 protein [Saprospiraceae bacterium]|nr:glycosyltransferase family 2 protein [Saprospiraceae bacterium]